MSAVQRQGQGGAGQHVLRDDGRLYGVQELRVPLQRVLVLPPSVRHQHLRQPGGPGGAQRCQTCRGLCRVPVLLGLRKVGVLAWVGWGKPERSYAHRVPWAYLYVLGMLRFMSKTRTNRTCPFCIYSVLVSISLFMALSTVFNSMNSSDIPPFSHSVLPVLFLPYWSFQLYIF